MTRISKGGAMKISDGLKIQLRKRLAEEIKQFKEQELHLDKNEILGDCFKINMYIVIYEILIANTNFIDSNGIWELVNQSAGIIENLYKKWVNINGDDYERIEKFVMKEVA